MGLFGKSKKEREKEYMNRLDVPLCLKEDFELIIDDVFTIMGVGTVATGNISTGIEISYIQRDLITVIFYYQISLKPLKTLSLSQVSFPLLFPLYYIVP